MEGPIIPVGNPDPKLETEMTCHLLQRGFDEGFTSTQELA